MPHHRKSHAIATTSYSESQRLSVWLAGTAVLIGGAVWAGQVWAENHEQVITSHGYSNFGVLKYGPEDVLEYVNPDAPKGGEISQWSEGTFDTFNQYARDGVPGALNTLPYENVMTATADDPYGSYCYLCTTIAYPPSLDWVIFNIRDDVHFSDGTPMTAEDVKFSFELFSEQGITEYRSIIEGFIESVEVLGPYQVKYTFTPEAPRREVVGIAGGTPVFSKAWFEETGKRLDEASDVSFMGTGPYLLDSYDTNRRIIYKRDPNWWGADRPINQGRNNFDTIRVEYFGDSSAAMEGFKSGAYTFRTENSSKEWATSYSFPAIEKGWVVKAELPDGSIGSGQGFVFNLDREKWQDPRVREAIRLMVNFEWMNETLFYGLYDRPQSFWDNTDLAATGVPGPDEVAVLKPLVDEGLLPESLLTDPAVTPPVSSTTNQPLDRANLRAASALLDEAGWVAGDDGMRRKDGQTLEAVFLQFSPQFDRIVNPIVENLKRLGVDARLDRVDSSQYIERRRSGDFDLTNHGFNLGFEPGIGLRQYFASETADDSSRNLMRLRDPGIDKLMDVVIDAKELEELKTSVRALDRALRADGFWIPQWFKSTYWVAFYDMYRHPETLPPFALGELDFWWYDAEAAERLKAAGAFQ